jgi:hypothetical protein
MHLFCHWSMLTLCVGMLGGVMEGEILVWVYSGQGVRWTNHLHLVLKSRKGGTTPPLSLHAFMVCTGTTFLYLFFNTNIKFTIIKHMWQGRNSCVT